MQLMVAEYARHVCGLEQANSTEVDEDTPHPVIDILPKQRQIDNKGGTMRLGAESTYIREETKAYDIYQQSEIKERFRHRYELNPNYHEILQDNGLVFSGHSSNEKIIQIIELPQEKHPFYFGTQFHPEYTSRFEEPNPAYYRFFSRCLDHKAD